MPSTTGAFWGSPLFTVAAHRGLGDFGYCTAACNCAAECTRPYYDTCFTRNDVGPLDKTKYRVSGMCWGAEPAERPEARSLRMNATRGVSREPIACYENPRLFEACVYLMTENVLS